MGRAIKKNIFKALKILAIGLASLVLLLTLGIIWLGTESGAGFVFTKIKSSLESQGLSLSASEFRGPLPRRLLIKDLTLADSSGPLFSASQVELQVSPLALLQGRAHINFVRIDEPRLNRVPKVPSSPSDQSADFFSLPISIILDEAKISGGLIDAGALSEVGLDNPDLSLAALASLDISGGQVVAQAKINGLMGAALGSSQDHESEGAEVFAANAALSGLWSDQAADLKVELDSQGLLNLVLGLVGSTPTSQGVRLAETEPLQGLGNLNLTATIGLSKQAQKVENLLLAAPGFELKGAGSFGPDKAASGSVTASLAADSPIWATTFGLLELPANFLGGDLALEANISRPTGNSPLAGELSLSGQNLSWPQAWPQLLGQALTLKIDLSGGDSRPFLVKIATESGPTSLGGQLAYTPAETMDQAVVTADLTAALTDLKTLDNRLAGPLALTVNTRGPLSDFKAEVSLASPGLTAPQGQFLEPQVTISAAGALVNKADQGSEPSRLEGRVSLAVQQSPGGSLDLSAGWGLTRGANDLALSISQLQGNLAGLKLAGDLTANLATPQPHLTGQFSAHVDQWNHLAALTGLTFRGGAASISLSMAEAGGQQSLLANVDIPDLKISQKSNQIVLLEKTAIDLQVADLFGLFNIKLNLGAGPGLIGPFSWQKAAVSASGQEGQGDFQVALERIGLKKVKPGASDNLKLAGNFDLRSPAEANSDQSQSIHVQELNFLMAGSGLKLEAPFQLFLNPLKLSTIKASLTPKGHLEATADLTPGAMAFNAEIKSLPFRWLQNLGLPLPDGEIELNLEAAQNSAGLAGKYSLKTWATPPGVKLKPQLELTGQILSGSASALTFTGTLDGGPGWGAKGKLSGKLPLKNNSSGLPELDFNSPLTGELSFSGPVGPLWKLADQPDRHLSGMMEIQAQLGGSFNRLQPQGVLYLAGGSYEDSILGLLINEIKLETQANSQGLLTLASAKDSFGGAIALEAKVSNFSQPSLVANGQLKSFNPLHRDDLSLFISGTLGAEGPLTNLAISSNLTVDKGQLDLKIALAKGSVPTLTLSQGNDAPTTQPSKHHLALKINFPNQFFIRGLGLDSEWKGKLAINGSTNRPSLVGFLAPIRGYFEIFSKQFLLSGGDIAFNGGLNPNLNLELTNQGPSIKAILHITGAANKPKLSFTSEPPLPQEEVVSQILFGKSATDISRMEALQLAASIKDLANFGQEGFNALSFMRKSLGLDVLKLGGGSNQTNSRSTTGATGSLGQDLGGQSQTQGADNQSAMSVEAGKYISDNIYVGVEQNASGGSAVRLEVELRPNLSLEGRTSSESSRVGLGWKKDY